MSIDSIDTLSKLFTIVEAIAVTATLIFIGVQVREGRRASVGSAYQTWVNTINNFYAMLAQTPDIAEIYWKGRANITQLSDTELPRFFYLCVQWFSTFESLYVQHREGLIPEEFFKPWQEALRDVLADSGLREYWRLERETYTPYFRKYVDELVKSGTAPSKVNAFLRLRPPGRVSGQTGSDTTSRTN